MQNIVLKYNNINEFFFTLFTPSIVDNQLTTVSPTKCTALFPDILYLKITFNTATCFDPLWGHH